MAEPRPAFDFIQVFEGGGILHTVPGDPGGTTKWGFSQRANPDVDIAALDEETALELFVERYWEPLALEHLRSQAMANEIAEFAFHVGVGPPSAAVRAAQQAANETMGLVGAPPIAVDARMGPVTLGTLNAIHALGPVHVMAWDGEANRQQLAHYLKLRKELLDRFLRGWSRRVV